MLSRTSQFNSDELLSSLAQRWAASENGRAEGPLRAAPEPPARYTSYPFENATPAVEPVTLLSKQEHAQEETIEQLRRVFEQEALRGSHTRVGYTGTPNGTNQGRVWVGQGHFSRPGHASARVPWSPFPPLEDPPLGAPRRGELGSKGREGV